MFHSRSASRLRRLAIRCLFTAATLGCASIAQADRLGDYQSITPAIAFDNAANRGLAVYEHDGRIWGHTVDTEGRVIAGTQVRLFPADGNSTARYHQPAIVFKRPQNRYYIAATRTTRMTLNGSSYQAADGIEVLALDRNFARLATQVVGSPGMRPFARIAVGELRPGLAADGLNDADCCVGLTWTDARDSVSNQVYMTNFDPALQTRVTPIVAVAAGANYATDATIAYDETRDRYAIAYNKCNIVGAYCGVGAITMNAWNFGNTRALPLLVRGTRIPSRPSIAYVRGAGSAGDGRYVLAWNWQEGAARGVGVNLLRDTGTALTSVSALDSLSYGGGWLSNTIARANPRVISLEDARRAIELDPRFQPGQLYAGQALLRQGQLDEAESCFRQMLEVDPHSADAVRYLGRVCQLRRDFAGALEAYRRAEALLPAGDPRLGALKRWIELARAQQTAGDR